MGTLKLGVAIIDITPEPGLMQAGFIARTEPAMGAHDPLTVRALVVGDTALVVADVIGIHAETSARVRARCPLPDSNVVVAATHTHGAPNSVPDRLAGADAGFVQKLEDACVAAIEQALASAVPGRLSIGMGPDPDVGRNRRHDDGPLDRSLPVLRIRDAAGKLLATLVSYACHPTVLGADNRLMTGDYPHYLRQKIERANPGSVALFFNGCCGDVNIGHKAHASWTVAANNARTYENAERLGERIADAALAAPETPIGDTVSAADITVELTLERRDPDLPGLIRQWEAEAVTADPLRRRVLANWIDWGKTNVDRPAGSWTGRVTLLDWGGVPIVALPGEIFAETSLSIRAAIGDRPALVLSHADAAPGYIPASSEIPYGGYEVDEAYRFTGLPGAFAPGSAERLAEAAKGLLAAHKQAAN